MLIEACACMVIGFHSTSYHPQNPAMNNVNPGQYVRYDNGLTLGHYFNSERKHSSYIGYTIGERVSLTGGIITGYKFSRIAPLATASVKLNDHFRLFWVPKVPGATTTHVFHIAFEKRI